MIKSQEPTSTEYYSLNINNFQGIDKANIKIKGFTSIQGATSCGKSSIRRALNSLLSNEWESSYIRKNTNVCKITFAKHNSNTDQKELEVTYTRKEGENTYHLHNNITNEDNMFVKPASQVPDEIKKLLNITKFDCNKEEYNLHISRQQTTEPLFMIAYSEPQNTRILNRVFNVAKYEVAGELCQKSIRSENADIKQFAKLIKENEVQIKTNVEKLDKLSNSIKALDQIITKLQVLENLLEINKNIQTLLQEKQELTKQKNSVACAKKLLIKMNEFNKLIQTRKAVKELKAEQDNIQRNLTYSKLSKNLLGSLKAIEAFESIFENKEAITNNIVIIQNELLTLKDKESKYKNVIKALDQKETEYKLIDLYNTKLTTKSNTEKQINNIKIAISEKQKELDEIGVCPYCNQKLDSIHTHSN